MARNPREPRESGRDPSREPPSRQDSLRPDSSRSDSMRQGAAKDSATRESASRKDSKRPSPWNRTRLSTMPLAVLLPQLSDVGVISQYREEIAALLEQAQDQLEIAESSESGTAQVELSMLQQVLQWLDVDSEE